MSYLITQFKQLLPQRLKRVLKQFLPSEGVAGYEKELGTYILGKAKDFSKKRGGMPEALETSQLQKTILRKKCLKNMNEVHQFAQTAFMPHYEQNLYEYYRQQQYLILLTFLSYPFRGKGCLSSHVQPFVVASQRLSNIRAIDYGAGLPFGLIHLMRTCPEKVESITIVDLDLIHTELTEYILSCLCVQTDIAIMKVRNPEDIPEFGSRTFNLIYGKDIFEHLQRPERVLRAMLEKAESSCLCYFDFRDHGAKYLQHVHPKLSHLGQVLSDYSFQSDGVSRGLSQFVRNI